ncbi:GAF domain-containing protein [Pseudomonas soli]|uniref:GAF domain-containing protein n=1 Tax=Pseudomonas soli TaxID=1306993 RepID=UPI0028AA0833|nr:hypothetical protein [Pseudomonas soli]
MELKDANRENKGIERNIVSITLFSANTWMTLVAPLIIGLFASKLFAQQEFTKTENIFYGISLAIHIFFAIVIFTNSFKKSTSLAIDDTLTELDKYKSEAIPKAQFSYRICKTQQSVTYLMTLELESLIDEINSRPDGFSFDDGLVHWESGLNRILLHLVEHRTELFGYKGDAFYNFALYLYDKDTDELKIKWRSHDNRMTVTGRTWKPGFGHVGLAFIQGEAKICQDITLSSELSDGSTEDSDKKKYRSFISVPVKDSYKVHGGGKPLGVLVFTSNHTNQFSWDRDKIFTLTVAKILSMYIERQMTALLEAKK